MIGKKREPSKKRPMFVTDEELLAVSKTTRFGLTFEERVRLQRLRSQKAKDRRDAR